MRLSAPDQWNKIHVVRCGVDLERFKLKPQREPHVPARILTVARLAPEKGHLVLFEALQMLHQRGVPVRLDLCGDGPFRSTLERSAVELGIADSVTFHGAISQDSILEYLYDADVFCLPSFSEGLPVAIMEALAVGLPVVATAITGIPELVEDKVSGRLVRAARPDLLADAIESLVVDHSLRQLVTAEGRRRVENEFSIDGIVPRLAKLFKRTTAG
jgi:glycosyltransferase involved in cell wall biosynthesis